MSDFVWPAATILIGLGALGFIIWQIKRSGRQEERNDHQDAIIENLAKTRDARRRLVDDPDYRQQLQDRFTRK